MASQAEKERQRRHAIEQAWTPPPPRVPPRSLVRASERPGTARTALRRARALGFTVREIYEEGTLPPTWKRAHPDDPRLSYVAEPAAFYRLGGLLPPLPLATPAESAAWARAQDEGIVVAFELVWINRATARGRWYDRDGWHDVGVAETNAALARMVAAGRP